MVYPHTAHHAFICTLYRPDTVGELKLNFIIIFATHSIQRLLNIRTIAITITTNDVNQSLGKSQLGPT